MTLEQLELTIQLSTALVTNFNFQWLETLQFQKRSRTGTVLNTKNTGYPILTDLPKQCQYSTFITISVLTPDFVMREKKELELILIN